MDKTDLQTQQPELARSLTPQEQTYAVMLARGASKTAAARAAGFSGTGPHYKEHVMNAVYALQNTMMAHMGEAVTRENLTMMLFESHRKAGSAMEEIVAVKEIAKLNDLYSPEKVEVDVSKLKRINQMEALGDDVLTKIAGTSGVVTIIDGESERID